jgi:hypothetical protein
MAATSCSLDHIGLLRGRQRRNSGSFLCKLMLGHVHIVFSLQAEPQIAAIAERELAKPQSHAPRVRLLFGADLVEGLPRHSEERGYFGFRLAKGRQHIFVQDRAGMH